MEMLDIYINEHLLDNIFDNLEIDDQIIFTHINKYTYTRYMYSVKSLVYQYINNDYNIFYTCICRYKYTDIELKRLCNLSLHNLDIDIIYGKRYYDLRYIFELLYRRRDIYNSIQIDNNKMNTIVKNIKTIMGIDRYDTINNINNHPMLFQLRHTLYIS